MRKLSIWGAGLAILLAFPQAANAEGITGLWRFDIINSAGTTLGAMTIQTRDTVQRQANAQMQWALAKGQGTEPARPNIYGSTPDQPAGPAGYTGFAMTDQGGHALPIESIDIKDGVMVMVVNSPRGLVIFRGKIDEAETRFDGQLTYHNGSVFTMRGVKQARLP